MYRMPVSFPDRRRAINAPCLCGLAWPTGFVSGKQPVRLAFADRQHVRSRPRLFSDDLLPIVGQRKLGSYVALFTMAQDFRQS